MTLESLCDLETGCSDVQGDGVHAWNMYVHKSSAPQQVRYLPIKGKLRRNVSEQSVNRL